MARGRVRIQSLEVEPARRGDALLERLRAVPYRERDAWIDRLLGFESAPDDVPELPRECVPYLPAGVNEILAMLAELEMGSEDVFVDIGSGLGRVVILTHLLSEVKAHGIEIQEPLVERAREHARALGAAVSFTHANAAEIELDGTVFFLYAPFNGKMRSAVLDRIEAVARRRPIRVCAVDSELSDVAWLARRNTEHASLAIYDSNLAWAE